jgi:RNA polymerase sigma-70 factor (subfamily 1)
MTASDEALFDQGRRGDAEAYRILFGRHGSALRHHFDRALPTYLRRRISAADLVQETRLVVLERAEQFEDRGPGSFRGWLFGIARFKAQEALRHHLGAAKRAVGREVTRGQRPDTAMHQGAQASPSQHAMAAEAAERASAAFAKLPEDYREILHWVRDEQLSMRDAGERMGRSGDAAKKLYARAVLKFTTLYEAAKERSHGE